MHLEYLTKDLHTSIMCTLDILYMPMDNTNNDLFILLLCRLSVITCNK